MISQATEFKFKSIDPRVTDHPIEKRGFVVVPFDYAHPEVASLSIFYRLIPANGLSPTDTTKPIIVVINGGPGIPSSFYRALNFDYQNADAPQNGPLNRFKYFLNTHRILLVDQRGTAGQSAPLDMDDPDLDVDAVARYFSSDSQARDHLAVIQALIPENEKFYLIAQSYGGMVGMQYLSLPEARRPAGMVFSSSALPYEDMLPAMMARRREQLKLNLELRAAVPDIEARCSRVRAHLQGLGLDPDGLNVLFTWLGKSTKGVWERDFVAHLQSYLEKSKAAIEQEWSESLGSGNLLNYILSSPNFTPGFTDRTLARLTSDKIPFEPWMIDENWVLHQTAVGNADRTRIVDEMDRHPPEATQFATVAAIRAAIGKNQLLFTAADNDAFVPAETYEQETRKFLVEGHTQIRRLPGGHHAIFLEAGHEAFLEWSAGI